MRQIESYKYTHTQTHTHAHTHGNMQARATPLRECKEVLPAFRLRLFIN